MLLMRRTTRLDGTPSSVGKLSERPGSRDEICAELSSRPNSVGMVPESGPKDSSRGVGPASSPCSVGKVTSLPVLS